MFEQSGRECVFAANSKQRTAQTKTGNCLGNCRLIET